MFEIKANLLIFDKIDSNYMVIPKTCKIELPNMVPIVWQDRHNDPDCCLGVIVKTSRNKEGVSTEGYIHDTPNGKLAMELIKDPGLHCGGYYTNVTSHKENGIRVIDSFDLRYVGLYPGSVYKDDSLRVEIVKEKENGKN